MPRGIIACKYMYNFSNSHYYTAFFLHISHFYSLAIARLRGRAQQLQMPLLHPKSVVLYSFISGGGMLLQCAHIVCLEAAIDTCSHLIFYLPIMFKRTIAITHNSRIVDVCIYPIFTRDKSIATLIVEPFYYALHTLTLRLVHQSYEFYRYDAILSSSKITLYL